MTNSGFIARHTVRCIYMQRAGTIDLIGIDLNIELSVMKLVESEGVLIGASVSRSKCLRVQ